MHSMGDALDDDDDLAKSLLRYTAPGKTLEPLTGLSSSGNRPDLGTVVHKCIDAYAPQFVTAMW